MTQEYISTTPRDREYWHLIPALHSLRAFKFLLHKLVSFEIGVECSTKEGNTQLTPQNKTSKEATLRWSRNYSFFCRNQRFITMFTGTITELVLFQINPAYSFPPKICKFQLSTILSPICWSPKWSLLFKSSDQNFAQIYQRSHSCHMSYPAHILVFHHPNNNGRVVQIMELLRP